MEDISAFTTYKKYGFNTKLKTEFNNKNRIKQMKGKPKQQHFYNTKHKKKSQLSLKKQNARKVFNKLNQEIQHLRSSAKKAKFSAVLMDENVIKNSRELSQIKNKNENDFNSVLHDTASEVEFQSYKSKDESSIVEKKLPPSAYDTPVFNNSLKDGTKLLKWLISPVGVDVFFEKFWEKKPCLIERENPSYFQKLISIDLIDKMLINNYVEFTKNIDVTTYKNGVRDTLNPEGRAIPPVVWDHYANGCSIRLLNPQTYLPTIYAMNSSLQEIFHCMVGSNVYLTPPNSQGFAPHYDDIEAFVLQIEGRKRWKLYNPRNQSEQLPRYSSENFKQNEIGKPILEKVLMPGDMLYFPRGTIHQAFTEPGYNSLHITLSVYQKQSYADLFEIMFPMILKHAITKNVDFRRGLPLNVWQNAGIVYSDVSTSERKNFFRRCRDLIAKSMEQIPIDQAIDQLAKKFQYEALPPNITESERCRTVFGSKNTIDSKGNVVCDYRINSTTKVRLLRANIMRLVAEDDAIRIYYYVDNSREYCEYEPNYIEIENEFASSVEVLIKSYPEYVAVNELPLEDDEQKKIDIVTALWERGLLMCEKPFSK